MTAVRTKRIRQVMSLKTGDPKVDRALDNIREVVNALIAEVERLRLTVEP